MTSLAELLAWPDRKIVVLAELTPSLALGGFVAAGGGLTNTYKVNLARTAHATYWTGGIYRRVVGVRENATDLTERASAALVDANALSWYWDEAAGVLYVRSSTSSDPDTFTAYQAFVTLYTATHAVVLNRTDGNADTGIYYLPWLSGDALPELSQEMADNLFGATINEGGELTFANGHGAWHDLIPTYNWKNKRVRLFIGGSYNGQDLLRSQYAAHSTLLVEDIAADEEIATLILKPLSRALDIEIPPTPFFAADYANLGDGVEGTKKWIGYGRAIMVPDLTDTTVSQGRYTVADAAKQTLFAVNSVWAVAKTNGARTLLTVTTHYTVDLTACTITVVSASYPYADYYLEADVTGKPDGAGSYLKTFGQIVKDMLTTFAGVVTADLVTADFTQADVDNPDEMAVWLKEPRSLASIFATAEPGFASLERSVMGADLMTLDGKWTVTIFDPTAGPSGLTALRKEDFAEFSPEPKLETVFATTRVLHNFDHARKEWTIEQKLDARTQYLSETVEVLEAHTFLRSASAAQTLAQRYQFISGQIPLEVEFSERGALLALHKAGDKVAVTYSPAPVPGGALSSRVFELLRITRSFDQDGLRISGRLGDLRGIGDIVGQWTSSTAPDWSAATPAQRDEQGFWGDSNGLIDPADPTTKDQSVWW